MAPVPEEWPQILVLAGFAPSGGSTWKRQVGASLIIVAGDGQSVTLKLHPTIGSHTPEDHLVNARAAAILFKVAMTLGERANGRLVQEALTGQCIVENMGSARVLAVYPLRPLRFEALCFGFREVLGGGIPQSI